MAQKDRFLTCCSSATPSRTKVCRLAVACGYLSSTSISTSNTAGINSVELERDDLLAELSAFPHVGSKSMDAATLIELAEEPLKSEFVDIFDEVQRVRTEFEYVNATNKELLLSEYEYVSFLIDQVTRIEEPGETYEDDGSLRSPVGKGMFDHRI